MSQLTFNIADYRPIPGTQIRTVQTPRNTNGFVVMSPGSGIRTFAEPAVVDIRRVRDAQRFHRGATCGVYQRRGKVLRFAGSDSSALEMVSTPPMTADMVDSGDLPPAA